MKIYGLRQSYIKSIRNLVNNGELSHDVAMNFMRISYECIAFHQFYIGGSTMTIEEMVYEVVKDKFHPLTTVEIRNMVNNLFELDNDF